MCQELPLHGPRGLCRQVACIGGALHLANVTHLDVLPQNILFRPEVARATDKLAGLTGLAGEGGQPGKSASVAQIALFDFDVAQIDGSPAFQGLSADHPRKATLLTGALAVLAAAASVGYEKCLDQKPPTTSSASSGWDQNGALLLRGMGDTHLPGPFEADLRAVLPPGTLTEENFASVRAQERVARQAHFCGRSKPAGVSFYSALLSSMEQAGDLPASLWRNASQRHGKWGEQGRRGR